jgi:hypothetical protein
MTQPQKLTRTREQQPYKNGTCTHLVICIDIELNLRKNSREGNKSVFSLVEIEDRGEKVLREDLLLCLLKSAHRISGVILGMSRLLKEKQSANFTLTLIIMIVVKLSLFRRSIEDDVLVDESVTQDLD